MTAMNMLTATTKTSAQTVLQHSQLVGTETLN